MAPRSKRRPYDPAAAKIHDRKTKDFNRGLAGHVVPIEIDDPMEEGGRLVVMRSTRDDPLGDQHARKTISEAQYQAGRSFQQDFERAESGPRGIELREWVDGGELADPLTEGHLKATESLKKVYYALGVNGSALAHDVLVHCYTMKQIAARRGAYGKSWQEYFGKRFREALDTMAVVYGFATK